MLPPHINRSPRVSPFDDPVERFRAGRFGMGLFLVSLGILFAASVLGFGVVRYGLRDLWPQDLPALPRLLWASTVLLVASSYTVQRALTSIRNDDQAGLRVYMSATLALGMAFLAMQAECWLQWLPAVSQRWSGSAEFRLALTSFYVLSGLHALHVVGGVIPITIVTRNAFRDAYSARLYSGVKYCVMYWHFLDGVWLVLFVTMLIGQ